YTWNDPVMVEDVQNWLGNPTTNHGWILIGVEGTNTSSKRFNSRENAESSSNPKLTVYYSEPLSDKVITSTVLNRTRIFPNPFRVQLSIEYNLVKDASVEWKVYNILGKEIRTLVDKYQAAGSYTIIWDGMDDSKSPVNQGMYYAIIRTGNVKIVYKIIKSQ
ncbi:MAG: T9SS type A sorting domain-containing protein, partial [Bacteroidales bacterium]|nr:T9SS type A sorting domain-containing protein [Bacteroidales bacterium]